VEHAKRTALIVPVPAAEEAVGSLRRRFDPSAEHGVPAHVTVLTPFLEPASIDEGVRSALGEWAAATEPFAFSLDRLGSFPGVVFLHTSPGEAFVMLTNGAAERFGTPPYEGLHDAVVPHLTVAMEDGDNVTVTVEECLEPHLPVEARAEEVQLLVEQHDGRWTLDGRWPLGG
jgi:2'-5' RNA ligase